jgi:hypothetical protein
MLKAVLTVFVAAYNKFGVMKLKCRVPTVHKNAKHFDNFWYFALYAPKRL